VRTIVTKDVLCLLLKFEQAHMLGTLQSCLYGEGVGQLEKKIAIFFGQGVGWKDPAAHTFTTV
jgi:hypothetical protein